MIKGSQKQQQGVALLTVVSIVAIITILAAGLSVRQGMDIRRTANITSREQALQLAQGGEVAAWKVLKDDGTKGQVDSLKDDWAYAEALPTFPVKIGSVEGTVQVAIHDQQGLFNLNNLVSGGKASAPDIQRFQRLLSYLKLDPNLAYAVVDWLDSDNQPMGSSGAESYYYMSLPRPYQAADRAMVSPSELRLLKGWDRDTVDKVLPFVSALPQRTTINVNTAPTEVLLTLADGITLEDARKLVEAAGQKTFHTIDEFLSQPVFTSYKSQSGFVDGIKAAYGVNSHYFLVRSHGVFDQGDVILYTLIERSDNNIMQTVFRSRGYY